MNKKPPFSVVVGFLLVCLGLGLWMYKDGILRARRALADRTRLAPPASAEPRPDPVARQQLVSAVKNRLRDQTNRPGARPGEATIQFKDENAYRDFLSRASKAGLRVLGKIDALHTVRVATDSYDALANDFLDHSADYGEVAANYTLSAPATAPEAQARAVRTEIPLGSGLLAFLGVTGDSHSWGNGVTIAVIDSGIQADTTFGTGRLRYLDVGLGTGISAGQDGGHGTGVAALAAGAAPDAQGVAPAAQLLSVRVADDTGKSDIFTLSEAIVAAVDQGARILNVSLGGYGVSDPLLSAIDYAGNHGAVIVAAAGNDQAAQLTWPAADPRVISVGAVDATGQQVIFSNSSPQLQITAPGYGVQTAWTDGTRVLMDGTSASAPIVSGAIAAMMSVNPGMNAPDAWKILQQYASDGGPAGTDPDYGHGVINLGWAMARNDSSRIDTAISSHYYDAASGTMNIVVQNRSGQAVNGLNLDVMVNGATSNYAISWMEPGAVQTVKIPVSQAQINADGEIQFVSQLNNPNDLVDQVPVNNRKVSVLSAPIIPAPNPSPAGH